MLHAVGRKPRLAGSCGSLGHGATLAPRRPTPEGEGETDSIGERLPGLRAGWICGNATLDLAASSLDAGLDLPAPGFWSAFLVAQG